MTTPLMRQLPSKRNKQPYVSPQAKAKTSGTMYWLTFHRMSICSHRFTAMVEIPKMKRINLTCRGMMLGNMYVGKVAAAKSHKQGPWDQSVGKVK